MRNIQRESARPEEWISYERAREILGNPRHEVFLSLMDILRQRRETDWFFFALSDVERLADDIGITHRRGSGKDEFWLPLERLFVGRDVPMIATITRQEIGRRRSLQEEAICA